MKQMRLSGTPQSGSLPSEDYESKETLKAIDQLVESMERDEKHISQLDTNRRVQSCSSPDTFVFVQFQMFFCFFLIRHGCQYLIYLTLTWLA